MRKRFMVFLVFLAFAQWVSSQASQDFDYIDYVYVPHIRSIEFKGVSNQTSNFPIIQLNRGSFNFSFDDLTEERIDYSYRVIHCDRNWKRSNLTPDEYIDGFDYEEIDNAAFSRNTYIDYTHYELQIPNRRYNWLISGNYLLVVYEGGENNGIPVITRRFMVAEQVVDVAIQPKNPIKVSKIKTHQEFDFYVHYQDFPISDPKQEISASILQNGNWNSMISEIEPNFNSNFKMFFNFNDRIVFPGGKEFRNFDIRRLENKTRWVHSIDLHADGADVILKLQELRKYRNYSFLPDLNGSFFISNNDNDLNFNQDANTGADYANVVFSLEMQPLGSSKDVYAIGSFSGWQPLPEYKMSYDLERSIYTNQVLFKQGYYDYIYAVVEDGKIDFEALEGNSYETVNNYQVLIYYKEFSGRFDRLIAAKTFTVNN